MQHTILTPSRPIGRTYSLSIVTTIFIFMSMAALAVMTFTRLTVGESTANPFLAYTNLFPGRLWRSTPIREFICFDIMITSSGEVNQECDNQPQTGPFSQVSVIVLDGIIAQLNFVTRGDALRVGDLAQLWGRPNRKWIHLYDWPEYKVTTSVSSDNGRSEYFLRVYSITFTL